MDDRAKVDCVATARALAPVIAAAVPRIEAIYACTKLLEASVRQDNTAAKAA